MRMLTIAFAAAFGLTTAATDVSAAGPSSALAQQPPAGAVQLAQYYPYYHRHYPYWDYPYYRRHHRWWYYDRPYWRYSEAEELNRQELQKLGVAP